MQESQSSSIRYSKILHTRRLPQIAKLAFKNPIGHHLGIVRVEFYCIKTLTLGVQLSRQRRVITSTRKSAWLDCYIDSNKEKRRATKRYKLHTWNTPTSMHRRAPISCTSIAKNCPWSGVTCHKIGETQIPRILKGPGLYQTVFILFLHELCWHWNKLTMSQKWEEMLSFTMDRILKPKTLNPGDIRISIKKVISRLGIAC